MGSWIQQHIYKQLRLRRCDADSLQVVLDLILALRRVASQSVKSLDSTVSYRLNITGSVHFFVVWKEDEFKAVTGKDRFGGHM